jgi:hypothetical protein
MEKFNAHMELLRENMRLKIRVSELESLNKTKLAEEVIERFCDQNLYGVAKKWMLDQKHGFH